VTGVRFPGDDRPLRLSALVPVVLLLALVGGCGSAGTEAPGSSAAGADDLTGTVTVLAAASLTDAFTSIAAAFEAANENVSVHLTFDGSSKLAAQILEGAPGDVFASADEANLAKVVDAGGTSGTAITLATNELQIVVGPGNPLGITGLADLTDHVVVALCRAEVPCGAYAIRAFSRAGIPVPPAGVEESVAAVLTKVQLGEADAGLVYRTDILAADGVTGVALAPSAQVQATYPASVLADAPNPRAASAFLAFLLSDEAQAILVNAGFGPP
jgi:molybdate transport system substrate-binding protein